MCYETNRQLVFLAVVTTLVLLVLMFFIIFQFDGINVNILMIFSTFLITAIICFQLTPFICTTAPVITLRICASACWSRNQDPVTAVDPTYSQFDITHPLRLYSLPDQTTIKKKGNKIPNPLMSDPLPNTSLYIHSIIWTILKHLMCVGKRSKKETLKND